MKKPEIKSIEYIDFKEALKYLEQFSKGIGKRLYDYLLIRRYHKCKFDVELGGYFFNDFEAPHSGQMFQLNLFFFGPAATDTELLKEYPNFKWVDEPNPEEYKDRKYNDAQLRDDFYLLWEHFKGDKSDMETFWCKL